MPELPEVETMCRGIAGVVGSRVVSVARSPCTLRPIAIKPRLDAMNRRLRDQRIGKIVRRGKRVGLRFEGGDILFIEPRMTGLVLLSEPPTREHVRLRIELLGGPHPEICFWDRRGLGTVTLYSPTEAEALLGFERLGPDALEITLEQFRERVGSSRRPVKVVLLDQQRVAGIGNLYAAEILHVARIDPRQSAHRLSAPQWQRLYTAMRDVLLEAIQYEGSTLGDGTYRNALNQTGSYQNHHRVYDRAGESCGRCGDASIQRIVQAQRSTFYCPRCQKRS